MGFDYPVFLDLQGLPVLVVGGGPVALRKIRGLADAGAVVTVIAPELVEGIAALASRIEVRAYRPGDLDGQHLVVTAADERSVNEAVASDARAARIFVNSADDPANCTFILPAIARRGPITVAVSTGGASPALAGRLRDQIADRELTGEMEHAAHELRRQRREIQALGGSTEDVDWQPRIDAALTPTSSLTTPEDVDDREL